MEKHVAQVGYYLDYCFAKCRVEPSIQNRVGDNAEHAETVRQHGNEVSVEGQKICKDIDKTFTM